MHGCPKSGKPGSSRKLREFSNYRKSHGNSERLMEVLRFKKSQKHLFQDLELDLANPISIFVQKNIYF